MTQWRCERAGEGLMQQGCRGCSVRAGSGWVTPMKHSAPSWQAAASPKQELLQQRIGDVVPTAPGLRPHSWVWEQSRGVQTEAAA